MKRLARLSLLVSILALVMITSAQAGDVKDVLYIQSRTALKLAETTSRIWGIANGGLVEYSKQDGSARIWTVLDGIPGEQARDLVVDSSGNVWCLFARRGLWKFNGQKWDSIAVQTNGADMLRLTVSPKGNLWILGRQTSPQSAVVMVYDHTNWKTYGQTDGLGEILLDNVRIDANEHAWASGYELQSARYQKSVVAEFQNNSVVLHKEELGLPPSSPIGLTDLSLAINNDVWVANDKGISRYHNGQWRLFPYEVSGALRISPRRLLTTAGDTIWTYGQGLAYFASDEWHTITTDRVPQFDYTINGLIAGTQGLTLLSDNGSLFEGYPGNWSTVSLSSFGPNVRVHSLFQSREQSTVLLNTSVGAIRGYADDWKRYADPNSLPATIGYVGPSSVITSNDTLWAILADHGVAQYDGKEWKHYTAANGLLNDTVRAIVKDKNGTVWIASRSTVSRFSANQWHHTRVEDTLSSIREYTALVVDSQNSVWASSLSKILLGYINDIPWYRPVAELHRWQEGTWSTLSLPSDTQKTWSGIKCLCATQDGRVYAGAFSKQDIDGNPVGGFLSIENGEIREYDLKEEMVSGWPDLSDVHCLPSGEVLVGLQSGSGSLALFSNGSWQQIKQSTGVEGRILSLGGLASVVLVGTNQGGIKLQDRVIVETFTRANALADNDVFDAYMDENTTAWLTPNGLYVRQETHSGVAQTDGINSSSHIYQIDNSNVRLSHSSMCSSHSMKLQVYDGLGRLVHFSPTPSSVTDSQVSWDLGVRDWSKGLYFLKVESDCSLVLEKLILQ